MPAHQLGLVDHALSYAATGLEVFPVRPDNKAPYTTNGMKDATTHKATIVGWWREWPHALIGCRIPEHLVVLDIDPRHNGHDTWRELETAYAPIPVGRQHHSGRNDGGFHIWAQRPAGKLRAAGLHRWAKANGVGHAAGKRSWTSGIDILHHGHRYTILPPSPHPVTGQPYEWDLQGDPLELPGYVVNLLVAQSADPPPTRPRLVVDADSIADWYTANHTWHDILPAAGWQLVTGDGDTDGSKWRHPNASAESSASIRHGCLFVYSDNTDFEATEDGVPHGITRFRAWATLEHDSDLSAAAAAARELRDGPRPNLEDFIKPRRPSPPDPTDPWPDPTPLNDGRDVPPFPVASLPAWMRAHVEQVAEEFQFPPDLPAQLAITALSIACARHAEVVVQGTWREPLNTYLATAMPPSAGKSPAFRAMLGCLEQWEADEIERTASERDELDTRRAILEKQKQKAINNGETAEALTYADEIRTLGEPVVPRLMADDATPEKLIEMLGEQDGRMALVSTEGGAFGLMVGRYSDKTNLNVYLQAWSGDSIRVDRIGRKSTVIMHPALTMGVTVQPSVIAQLAETPELAGRGLTARIMYAFPPSNVGYRDMSKPPAINPVVAHRYETEIVDLVNRVRDGDRNRLIHLEPGALRVHAAWRQDMEIRCRSNGDLHHMAEWVTKLGSTVARLAGLLALCNGQTSVDSDTMEAAVAVGRYWEAHARIAYDMWIGDPTATRAGLIVDWLAESDVDRFSLRDVCRAKRTMTADDVAEACALLVDSGWLRPLDDRPLVAGRRGVPSPELAPHPRLSCFRNNHVPMSHMSLKNNPITSSSSSSVDEIPTGGQGHEGHRDMTENAPPVDNPPPSPPKVLFP